MSYSTVLQHLTITTIKVAVILKWLMPKPNINFFCSFSHFST